MRREARSGWRMRLKWGADEHEGSKTREKTTAKGCWEAISQARKTEEKIEHATCTRTVYKCGRRERVEDGWKLVTYKQRVQVTYKQQTRDRSQLIATDTYGARSVDARETHVPTNVRETHSAGRWRMGGTPQHETANGSEY